MTPRTQSLAQPSREIVAQAAAWISRLHGSRRSAQVEAAFRGWLAADPRHARAFEGMTEIWDTMPAMQAEKSSFVEQRRPWARAAAVAVICVAAGVMAYVLLRAPFFTTGIGEQRIVNLEDGTRVSLNSATRVSIEYGDAERRIELEKGEAYFEVAHDPRLPFVVVAGGSRVTALGTAFAVRHDRHRTAVTLVEGSVTVASAGSAEVAKGASAPPARLLKPGQRWVVSADSDEKVDTPKVEAVTAWRRGEVILDETALVDAVAEMNRYDRMPLVIDDPHIAALPVSGIYRTGDSPGFARIVARMYGLAVSQEDGRIHLKRQY